MTKPAFHILPSGINLSYEGKVFTIPKGDRRHGRILDAIREGRFNDIPDIVEEMENYFARHEGAEFVNNRVVIDGNELPDDLNHYILALAEDGIPFDRMISFWRRWKSNPHNSVRVRLFSFLQRMEHPITEDGRFLAYRRVRVIENRRNHNGDLQFPNKPEGDRILVDLHTGTVDNTVGETVSMDRGLVCDDPHVICASGLHAASFNYAKRFYGDGVLVEVAIAPENVVCCPIEYGDEKMRCCEYEVLNEIEGPRSGPVADLNEDSLISEAMAATLTDEDESDEDGWGEYDHLDY